MIERNIFQIWIQGETNLPSKFKRNAESIKKHHPEWSYSCLGDVEIRAILSEIDKKYLDVYNGFSLLAQKSDYARYILLYIYGGLYADVDVACIKPLDPLLDSISEDLIVSKTSLNAFESVCNCRDTYCINNGIIACKKGNPIMLEMIEYINANPTCRYLPSMLCVMQTTGPNAFFNIIKKHMKEVKILEAEYFEPCVMNECKITDNTYLLHMHEGSWSYQALKPLFKFFHKYKGIILILFIIMIYVSFFK
jgi:mannosyltransferase OCH1-like enzyme